MRVKSESEVIENPGLRKAIIEEINGPENMCRKDEAYRRHLCYKDKTKVYVLRELLKQFDDETVREMGYSISNISLGRKIIDKLGRVYANGVRRTAANDAQTELVELAAKQLDFNRVMKRANRYLRMHRNTVVGVLPCPVIDLEDESYDIKAQAYQPHLYDVVEDYYNREKPMFIILSNYKPSSQVMTSVDPAKQGRGATTLQPKKLSDGKDQTIADKKEDENAENEQYIWWSKHYHFTTNAKGEMISQNGGEVNAEDIVNPIQQLPFETLAIDQEGSFWAEGGEDIFDGAVHVNCMITNVQHIGVTQGYGQFYMTGKNLPRFVKAGVNKSILMEVENNDDPRPELGFASANPKLQELKEQIVMYVALLLTTNNLSTKSISSDLSSSQDFASGISMIIDKSESIEDVQDQRDVFYRVEPKLFQIAQKWQAVYKDSLIEDSKKAMLPQDVEVLVKFNDYRPIMSESEKLNNMKLRKELGITSMLELLMIDDPELTKADAEKKLMGLLEDQMKETAKAAVEEEPEEETEQEDVVEEEQPDGEVEKVGKYYEDENGDLWEKTKEGFKKVTKADVSV